MQPQKKVRKKKISYLYNSYSIMYETKISYQQSGKKKNITQ